MMKKLLSFCLAAALLIGIAAIIPMTSRAASEMKASEECIAIIKKYEGFEEKPYLDSDGLYTIGYGTRCPTDMVAYYMENPMTEEEADAALREKMSDYESAVNSFIDKHGLTYEQHQFDAVVSLVFNIGPSWLNKGSTLIAALAGGAQGNELIYAFSIYSMSGGIRSLGHIRRRLAEANIYLNGEYGFASPANFGYVLYDAQGGALSTYNVQGYDTELTAAPIATASKEGYIFKGWFTAAVGGTQVTVLDASTKNLTLYAQWEADPNFIPSESTESTETTETTVPETTAPAEPEVVIPDGTPIETVQVQVTGSVVNIRKGPGLSYEVIGSVVKGDKLSVSATYENDDHLWGKFDLGWVCLDNTNYSTIGKEPEQTPPAETPSGSTSNGNTGSGSSTGNTSGSTSNGNVGSGTSSGNTSSGSSGSGTSTGTTKPSTSTTTTVTKTYATIINTNTQNVRKAPDGAIVGVLYKGDKVEILEQKTVNGRLWGRCSKGWICMRTYVKLETVTETVGSTSTGTSGSTSNNTSGSTSAGTTKPSTSTTTTVTKTYATVIKTSTLNIRKTPDGTVVGKLYLGDKVEILEQKTVNGRLWGRCSKGWICMRTYVKLSTVKETVGGTTTTQPDKGTEDTTVTVTKTYATIINTNSQNVRKTPDGAICGTLKKGDKVEILEQKTVNGRLWGRCSKGWICMRTYVKLETVTEKVSTSNPTVETGKITATCLNIRSGAGTNNSIVGQLYKDTTVVILEKKTVNGTTWARIDKGWISMTYVK